MLKSDTRRDVIGEIVTFYSDLLDRRGAVALEAIGKLIYLQVDMRGLSVGNSNFARNACGQV